MSVILDVRQACEKRLTALSPSVLTFYEGTSGETEDVLYQRCQFNILPPDDPVVGTGYYRERIEFQVFVISAYSEGAGAAYERAELIRSSFYKSLTLTENTTKIHVLRTASIGSIIPTTERLVVPVIIGLLAEVYS